MLFPCGVAKTQKHGCEVRVPFEGDIVINTAYSAVWQYQNKVHTLTYIHYILPGVKKGLTPPASKNKTQHLKPKPEGPFTVFCFFSPR